VLGYNWLVGRNKNLQEDLRNFAADVHAYLVGGARIGGDGGRPVVTPAVAVRK
jgi:biopolymer transport protein ExbB